jgi:molybdopterin molybdotransferase
VPPGQRAGQHRRFAGEDLALGGIALPAGCRLGPAHLGLAASLGIAELPVRRRLRVAFFSTGDELRSIGQTLAAGEVYDSNRYTLWAMLHRLGVDIVDLGVVRDDPAALEQAMVSAAQGADAVISSGGVSVGEADFTREILDRVGEVAFWKVAMRPGRPMAVGRVGQAAYFGLPGNPVAVMVTFLFFVRDALLRMAGATPVALPRLQVRSAGALRKRPGRTEFQRAIVAPGADGQLEVRVTGQQGSGVLRSMAEANAMIVLNHDQGDVHAGDLVSVILFEGLL